MLRNSFGIRFEPQPDPASAASGHPAPAATGDGGGASGAPDGSPADGATASPVDWEARARTAEADARTWQSRHDQAVARAQGQTAPPAAPQPPAPLTQEAVLSTMEAVLERRDAIATAVAEATENYPNAHPDVFRYAKQYASPADFLAAAQESHKAETEYREGVRQEVDAEVRKSLGAAAPPPPPAAGGATGQPATGEPSIQQFAEMEGSDFDQVPVEVIERQLIAAERAAEGLA